MTAPESAVLAEPDGPTRVGLRLALGRAGVAVVGEAVDRASTLDAARSHQPGVVLIAADLPGGGLEATRAIADELPRTKVVVLTLHPGGAELLAAVLAGATGYLPKEISAAGLPNAVRGVLAGELAIPRSYTRHLVEGLRGRHAERAIVDGRSSVPLTDREWEVLRLLSEGLSTAEMARDMRISQITVRRHVSTLLTKLGVPDRATAARLLQPPGRAPRA